MENLTQERINDTIRKGRELLKNAEFIEKQNQETQQEISKYLLNIIDTDSEEMKDVRNILQSEFPVLLDRQFIESIPSMKFAEVSEFKSKLETYVLTLLERVEQNLCNVE